MFWGVGEIKEFVPTGASAFQYFFALKSRHNDPFPFGEVFVFFIECFLACFLFFPSVLLL